MPTSVFRRGVNILSLLAVIVVNGLANALPLNGQMTGEISDRFQVYFVPAGYVFSIWGVIYLGLILFAVYQATPAQRENPRLTRVGYAFALSCLANIAWLFLWHYELFLLAPFAMLALLLLLVMIYRQLEIGRTEVSPGERWLVQLPFSVYLGWISVATIANVTSTLDYLDWNRWGISAEAWTVVMLLAGAAIAAVAHRSRNDGAFLLVAVWAFVGIAIKHLGTPVVALAAGALAALLALSLLLDAVRSLGRNRLPTPAG